MGSSSQCPNIHEDPSSSQQPNIDEDPYRWKAELPIGIKFRPTEQELLLDYLWVKFKGGTIPAGIISDLDVYDYPPEILSDHAFKHDDGRMYFFTYLKRKDRSFKKSQRTIKDDVGYWKATQVRGPVYKDNRIIGTKTPLTYYRYEIYQNGKRVESKLNWQMHEYRYCQNNLSQDGELALCVVYYLGKTRSNLINVS